MKIDRLLNPIIFLSSSNTWGWPNLDLTNNINNITIIIIIIIIVYYYYYYYYYYYTSSLNLPYIHKKWKEEKQSEMGIGRKGK